MTSSVKNPQTNNTLQEAPAGNITIKHTCSVRMAISFALPNCLNNSKIRETANESASSSCLLLAFSRLLI